MTDKPRCQATHPVTHVQCGQPEGHKFTHSNAYLTPSWEDEPEVKGKEKKA